MSKTITNVVLYDTHAEIPTSGTDGQLVWCREHGRLHSWTASGMPQVPANTHTHSEYSATDHTHEGGSHPDLATHLALGLEEAGSYATSVHDHNGTYEPTHAHPYAADNHTHAGGSGNATVSHLVACAALSKTMTNIGATYKDIYVALTDLGNDSHLIDFTGAASFRVVFFWDYVGAGSQQVRWVNQTNNNEVLWESAGFTADQSPGDSGWQTLPAAFQNVEKTVEWQGKSATAADDPIAKGFRIFLK